jgi:hypothetical protein
MAESESSATLSFFAVLAASFQACAVGALGLLAGLLVPAALRLSSADPNSNNVRNAIIFNSLASPNCSTCKILLSPFNFFSET